MESLSSESKSIAYTKTELEARIKKSEQQFANGQYQDFDTALDELEREFAEEDRELEMEALRQQLAAFYAKRIDDEMDSLWESGQYDAAKLQELRGSHFRTSYK